MPAADEARSMPVLRQRSEEVAMRDFSRERRRLLLSTAAWLGGAATLAAARPAGAFQVFVASPDSSVGTLYANRCGPSSEHAAIVAELQARLAQDPALTSLTAACPICGCPVTVSR